MGKKQPKPEKPWMFRSFEGKGNHLLSATESKNPKTGKKVTTLKKIKPGNSNN